MRALEETVLRVVQMGLGPIGRAVAARARSEPGIELVGAVDADSGLVGTDLGGLLGGEPLDLEIAPDVGPVIEATGPDLVLHATGSFLEDVAPQLLSILGHGVGVVSTCEELAYPFYRHPELARKLDRAAWGAGTVLLGSGVNPGFVMDKFVVTMMAACESVDAVLVRRVVDAATRRGSFQKKIGAGLTPEAFDEKNADGRMGHIGLVESAHMLADAMGADRERRLERSLYPVLAEALVATDHVRVAAGNVAGIRETVVIHAPDRECVRMELEMFVWAPSAHDAFVIDGSPRMEVEVGSGVAGGEGTVAVMISCAPLLLGLEAGLRTMLDVPLVPPTAPRGILKSPSPAG
jgi:4-hydroxy-tetrahydrodipicolinate reductase